MTNDLQERLQGSVGSVYAIERELGGGGMSRVFVADETSLGRKVVVKVLTPELAAGVNVDRFRREIQVAARLQHPHIVPVLSVGEFEGLPFYTMPLVDGSSVRARLDNGPLTITETLDILRDVARALAYAHANGVVHRDIKPDNVLLTGGSATVTDFGIAKALSAARDEGPGSLTLTAIGTSLGTPAYMAPEQSAGDPTADHRSDLYSFGCMAYELLGGQPPFVGLTSQRLFAAHMSQSPVPISELRLDTPAVLAEIVMRCLEKDPDNRPQTASEIDRILGTISESGNGQAALPALLLGGRGMFMKALAVYAGAFIVVALLARVAIVGIGLPDWVFPGALFVMGLGLPVILFTAFVQRATRRVLTAPTLTPGGSPVPQRTMATIAEKAAPHVSWSRTAMGGAIALGAFIMLVGGWMLMRALGIGPAGSLMGSGKLAEKDRVILTEFKGPVTDSLLGPTVTEAFRTDLAQSQSLSVVSLTAVSEALQRMQRPVGTRVDYALAREIASREGIKAVIDGEVVALGGSYVLSARLIAAQTGEDLAPTFRETAESPADIIPAISRLSKKVREKTGESLRRVQRALSLERVTTPSLPALQKYVAGVRAIEVDGDWDRGRVLLEEAISLDTGFAMAYRKLGTEQGNRNYPRPLRTALIQKAYDHRDRLTEAERYLTTASYFGFGPKPDQARIISALESLLEIDPLNYAALNNLAVAVLVRREYARAEDLAKRALTQRAAAVAFGNVIYAQARQGKMVEVQQTLAAYAKALPRVPERAILAANLHALEGDYTEAARVQDSLRQARLNEPVVRQRTDFSLGVYANAQGRIVEGLRWSNSANDAALVLGARVASLRKELDAAQQDAWFRGNRAKARSTLDKALIDHPLDSLEPVERPHDRLVELYAMVGEHAKARAMLAAFERRRAEAALLYDERTHRQILGHIAMAEQQYTEAVTQYRAADYGSCEVCAYPNIARAYDLAGNADSAIAFLDRYVSRRLDPVGQVIEDGRSLAGSHKRLAELYDTKGKREKAMSHYARFIELWKYADADLQPHVKKARDRLAQLQRAER